MSRKFRKRQDRIFKTVIALLCMCAVVLMAAIVIQSRLDRAPKAAVQTLSGVVNATTAPMTVLSPDSQLSMPTPTPQPTAEPTPVPTEKPFEYLPVYTGIETAEKVIAITLDDCTDLSSLKYAANAAEKSKAKLTLLPVAKHVLNEENRAALQYCVFTLGYQVENRTLNKQIRRLVRWSGRAWVSWLP